MTLPRALAKYELLEEVGKGGMSIVYRGLDTTLNREVAVKILHEHLAGEEETRRRFQREAHAVAKLRHPNILEIFDYSGVEAQESYIVTEFIRGRTLKQFLNEHAVPLPEVAAMIVAQLCRAVQHAHAEGVIHRDIKPENIMIRSDGVLKLMDFGIAQIIDVQRLTVTGQLLGSPAYMAPEQIDGRTQDARTDVFSLGTLLYELATGALPFRGKNAHEILKRISEGVFTDPETANPALGGELAAIVRRALAHRPEDRFPDVISLMESLEAYLQDVGFTDVDAELGQFFSAPLQYGDGARHRLVDRLVTLGRESLAGRRTARALAHLNRVLAIEPEQPEVHALLDRMARRRRLGRTAGALIALAAMSGVVYGSIYFLRGSDPTPVVAAGATVAPPPETSTGDRIAPPLAKTHIPKRSRERAASRPQIRKEITLAPHPKAVTMTLDGEPLGVYGSTTRIPLLARTQVLRLSHPVCADRVVEIRPTETRRTLQVRLDCPPGRVRIACDAPDAEVRVGETRGRPGEEISVPLEGLRERSVTLVVQAPGYATYREQVTVRHDRLLERSVRLEPVAP